MPGRRLTAVDLERAIEMRERGLSLKLIGSIVGVSASALSWHFLKHAVDPPKPAPLKSDHHLRCPTMQRGKHIVRAFSPAEDAHLLELERQGYSDTAIGRALNRKPNSIRGRLMTLARREERAAS